MRVLKCLSGLIKLGLEFTLFGHIILTGLESRSVIAAEKITFTLSILGEFYLSVDDLVTFC